MGRIKSARHFPPHKKCLALLKGLATSLLLTSSAEVFAQATNGTFTVTHEVMVSGGGQVGGGNPMSAVTVIGTPIGGASANTSYTVQGGYPSTQADTTPPSGTITINSGAAYTAMASVPLTLSATDNSSTVSRMQFSNDNATYTAPEAYATSKSWTLPLGDGTKTVYVKFKDAASNWSQAASDSITLDTAPPTISATGASNLTSTSATIIWTTNEPATSQVEYGLTTTYGSLTALDSTPVASHSVTISGLSANTLYHYRVHSQDGAGNSASSADLTFTTAQPDTTLPSGSVAINGGAAATNKPTVTLTLSATDNSGTVSQMQFSNDNVTYSAPESDATSKTWTLPSGDGIKTVYVKFSDPSGNWSTAASDSITLDTTPPVVTISSPSDGAVFGAQ